MLRLDSCKGINYRGKYSLKSLCIDTDDSDKIASRVVSASIAQFERENFCAIIYDGDKRYEVDIYQFLRIIKDYGFIGGSRKDGKIFVSTWSPHEVFLSSHIDYLGYVPWNKPVDRFADKDEIFVTSALGMGFGESANYTIAGFPQYRFSPEGTGYVNLYESYAFWTTLKQFNWYAFGYSNLCEYFMKDRRLGSVIRLDDHKLWVVRRNIDNGDPEYYVTLFECDSKFNTYILIEGRL